MPRITSIGMFFWGAYERDDLLVMRSLLSKIPHAVVLDIGANVGRHSLALAPLAAIVHAFEPYPPRLASLRANVARNPHLRIVIHPIALGDAEKDAPFRLPVTGEWAGVQFDPTGSLRFPMRNTELYFKQNGFDRIDLIKLDVDGNELDILINLRSHIERLRPLLVVEAERTIASLADIPAFTKFSWAANKN